MSINDLAARFDALSAIAKFTCSIAVPYLIAALMLCLPATGWTLMAIPAVVFISPILLMPFYYAIFIIARMTGWWCAIVPVYMVASCLYVLTEFYNTTFVYEPDAQMGIYYALLPVYQFGGLVMILLLTWAVRKLSKA